jgi:hypothetical protein
LAVLTTGTPVGGCFLTESMVTPKAPKNEGLKHPFDPEMAKKPF